MSEPIIYIDRSRILPGKFEEGSASGGSGLFGEFWFLGGGEGLPLVALEGQRDSDPEHQRPEERPESEQFEIGEGNREGEQGTEDEGAFGRSLEGGGEYAEDGEADEPIQQGCGDEPL